MGGLFAEAGLTDVVVEAAPVVLRDPTALDNAMGLRTWAAVAHERGALQAGGRGGVGAGDRRRRRRRALLYSFSVFPTAGGAP